jgi:redox-sensitive bicupin YhaK (pirin superfamily)
MITLRKASERGHFDFGWLDTNHTFSFGEYYDPSHMGFRSLRVINEDRVQGGQGFGTHGHRDMEILTYVLEGALEHKDSTGTHGIIKPGDAQRMSAGTGIMHSEANASKKDGVHFLQIWILPAERGIKPGYEQKNFPAGERTNRARVIASPDGREGSIKVSQDAVVYSVILDPKAGAAEVPFELKEGRAAWVQVAKGDVEVGTGGANPGWTGLKQSDGAAVEGERSIVLKADAPAEVLVFDLA